VSFGAPEISYNLPDAFNWCDSKWVCGCAWHLHLGFDGTGIGMFKE
jgi:hypothetical protein